MFAKLESSEATSGVTTLAVLGMGGVGKTQIVTEYCHAQYKREYGLVSWLNAESAEVNHAIILSKHALYGVFSLCE